MSTNFPVTLDSYSVKVDGVDDVLAAHINDPQDAIVAIESSIFHGLNNLLINGGFDIWQRTTNDTGVTTTRKYVADRWGFVTGASTLANVQRSTTVRTDARSKYSCELVGAASVTTVNISQRIEAALSGRYKRTLYFSGYIYNGSGASFTPKIYVSTPSAADNWTTSTVRNGSGSGENLQACADSAWTLVSWTAGVSGYTNIDNGLEIRIEIPSGSLVAGDTVRLAEFMLTTLVATPYVQQDIGIELLRCRRYLQFLPATNAPMLMPSGYCTSSTTATFNAQLVPPMRTTPTLLQTGTASHYVVSDSAASNTTCSAVPTLGGATNTTYMRVLATVASGLTQHRPAVLQSDVGSNGYLGFDAEL